MAYGVRLKVWGDYALFTRPETKGERCSYEVPTPSAARGILEAIHWKPAIRWIVTKIHVLNPVRFDSVRRNEVSEKGPCVRTMRQAVFSGAPLALGVEDARQQRASLILRDVAYVLEARFELTGKAGPEDNEGKHLNIFNRRAAMGQCFHRPCLGCREFPAFFEPVSGDTPASALAGDAPRDLGIMLYDIDFGRGMTPVFYRPRLENGVIDVERWRREALCS